MATTLFEAVNLGDLAPRSVSPDRLALIALDEAQRETRYTYGQLDALARAAARGLRKRGLAPGDRIAVLSANSGEFLALLMGALRAGITVVPVNYKFPRALSDFVIADSGAKLVFCDSERRANAPAGLPVVEFGGDGADGFDAMLDHGDFATVTPGPRDVALFLYTSGSTGKPKGVKLSHRSHLWVVKTRLGGQDLADQRYLVAAPMYHMNALALCQLALAGGSTIVLLPQFNARAYIHATSRYRATWLTSVPPMMAMMLREQEALASADLSSVQVVRMGSAPASAALLEAIRAVMPHARIINSYGTTEGGPVTFGPHPEGKAQPFLSIGYKHPQVDIRLVDEQGREADQGVLQLRSPGIMLGYHNRPDIVGAITDDGYYVTGDVLRRDEDGFFYFVGRNDDMFVCGGENIFPGEVEKVLETQPGVQQACVVAVPDDIKGHKPVAFVVLAPGAALDEAAVKAHALANAPAYQHPRRVWIVPALPLASTGKVDRKLLEARALEALERDGLAA
ncbi:MAG: class I adenylate-forming enzyme family protein [Pollutimonas bauzanensis]|uniref:Acyl-CoA synthetase (AMP-forming)/AMP-acid ligase II n=1 Tax=Pollutimonas bauzanensis TaxID=658167 RepID=A0A1M5Y616_9BURK|nr:class I adenylate-forming enzyme family protein [Pollutimonas bauzanensis]SHI07515.1 Acyl-CoA synthetase (AMP-forming)/AMP-acid ligase II [Pollutimonas bauzanensis]